MVKTDQLLSNIGGCSDVDIGGFGLDYEIDVDHEFVNVDVSSDLQNICVVVAISWVFYKRKLALCKLTPQKARLRQTSS